MRNISCKRKMINRGAWSTEEDEKLIKYIRTHGEGRWRTIPKAAGLLRCGKSCRLRWINYLRPDIKRGNFSEDEDDLIIKLHALLGNRWSLIAGRLPGRTDNEIKNQWNSRLSRKVKAMGVDQYKKKWSKVVPVREEATLTSSFSDVVNGDFCPRADLNLELTIGLPFSLRP